MTLSNQENFYLFHFFIYLKKEKKSNYALPNVLLINVEKFQCSCNMFGNDGMMCLIVNVIDDFEFMNTIGNYSSNVCCELI